MARRSSDPTGWPQNVSWTFLFLKPVNIVSSSERLVAAFTVSLFCSDGTQARGNRQESMWHVQFCHHLMGDSYRKGAFPRTLTHATGHQGKLFQPSCLNVWNTVFVWFQGGEGECSSTHSFLCQSPSPTHHWYLLECRPTQKTKIWEDQTNSGQARSFMKHWISPVLLASM